MRAYTILSVTLALALISATSAGPICGTIEEDPETGYKTWNAIKSWMNPMCKYFTQELPKKTPSVLVTDAKDTVEDVKLWAKENEMMQTLSGALVPVKTWLQDTRDTLKDQSFQEMYDNVKNSVYQMDDNIGTWVSAWNSEDTKQ